MLIEKLALCIFLILDVSKNWHTKISNFRLKLVLGSKFDIYRYAYTLHICVCVRIHKTHCRIFGSVLYTLLF